MMVLLTLRRWFKIFRSAYASWTATLGTALATVALCNMIFRAMDVSLIEVLRWTLTAYQKTFHPPIDYVTSIVGLRLPAAVKDALVAYLAMGGVLYRTLSYKQPSPLKDYFPQTFESRIRNLRMGAAQILAAVIWPRLLKNIFRNPSLLITSAQGYHGRLPPVRSDLPPVKRKQVLEEMLARIGGGAEVICNERELFLLYLFSLLAATACLVVLNAAIDLLGGAG